MNVIVWIPCLTSWVILGCLGYVGYIYREKISDFFVDLLYGEELKREDQIARYRFEDTIYTIYKVAYDNDIPREFKNLSMKAVLCLKHAMERIDFNRDLIIKDVIDGKFENIASQKDENYLAYYNHYKKHNINY